MRELVIDPVFRDALPRLTEKEFKQLEENILESGEIREPLIVWNNTIIDGHHRYEIAKKHPEIPFKVKQMVFLNQWDAIDWMCRNQLGKRNMTDAQKKYTLGKLYEARKNKTAGNPGVARGEHGRYQSHQAGGIGDKHQRTTEYKIAQEQGVGRGTVMRAAQFSKALDDTDELVPGFRDAVISGKVSAPNETIRSLNRMTDEERKEAAEAIMRGEFVATKKPEGKKNEEQAEPYNAEDFRMEIDQFPQALKSSIQTTLAVHGDMLQNDECKKDFAAMLDRVIEVANEFKKGI